MEQTKHERQNKAKEQGDHRRSQRRSHLAQKGTEQRLSHEKNQKELNNSHNNDGETVKKELNGNRRKKSKPQGEVQYGSEGNNTKTPDNDGTQNKDPGGRGPSAASGEADGAADINDHSHEDIKR